MLTLLKLVDKYLSSSFVLEAAGSFKTICSWSISSHCSFVQSQVVASIREGLAESYRGRWKKLAGEQAEAFFTAESQLIKLVPSWQMKLSKTPGCLVFHEQLGMSWSKNEWSNDWAVATISVQCSDQIVGKNLKIVAVAVTRDSLLDHILTWSYSLGTISLGIFSKWSLIYSFVQNFEVLRSIRLLIQLQNQDVFANKSNW